MSHVPGMAAGVALCADHAGVFLPEANLTMSKMVYNLNIELANQDKWDWMDQKAYLFFEPKSLKVKLTERTTDFAFSFCFIL